MKDKMIDGVIWTGILITSVAVLVTFSFVVGKVVFKDKTVSCGLVNASSGQCLEPVELKSSPSILLVLPSDNQAPNFNPQQTGDGGDLQKAGVIQ